MAILAPRLGCAHDAAISFRSSNVYVPRISPLQEYRGTIASCSKSISFVSKEKLDQHRVISTGRKPIQMYFTVAVTRSMQRAHFSESQ